ncbi:MAG TPA: prepilin peptidase [Candidatus Acidoferrales bacterium]|nr:prepilin peptidase [Candidatus Acidoferrales bacterium]
MIEPFWLTLCAFIFGAVVGSFLNVCIHRLPAEQSLIRPSSRCPACKTPIRYYDNIPLISYIVLLGRCRSCKAKISPRYFWVELITATMAVALINMFGLGFTFLVTFVLMAALIVIAFIDLDVRIVPDVISLPGIVLGFLFSLINAWAVSNPSEFLPSPLSSFLGILLGGGVLLGVAWVYQAITGVEGMGGGDVKLLAMIGAFLGWPAVPLTLFLGSLGGSVIGLALMLTKGVGGKYVLPFAPFLCLGAICHLFFGAQIISFYLGAQ